MEKISAEIIKKYLNNNEVVLKSTHLTLCVPIINRIYQKMIHGIKFDAIKTHEELIIDGHHRYISSLLANIEIESIQTHKTSATIIYPWDSVEFVEEEWDTPFKIDQLNKIDAAYNKIDLEKLIEITK